MTADEMVEEMERKNLEKEKKAAEKEERRVERERRKEQREKKKQEKLLAKLLKQKEKHAAKKVNKPKTSKKCNCKTKHTICRSDRKK